MADIGSTNYGPTFYSIEVPIRTIDVSRYSVCGKGVFKAVVKDKDGNVLANRQVSLFRRATKEFLCTMVSDVNGLVTFTDLPHDVNNPEKAYFIVAFDDTNDATDFNAVILDLLTPVLL